VQKKITKVHGSKTHKRIICAFYDFAKMNMKASQLISGGTGEL